MAASLKEQNRPWLFCILAINLAICYGAVESNQIFGGDWQRLFKEAGQILPAVVGLALTGIANEVISADMKSRIVFMRWRDALPGCQAFTHHGRRDPRVDMKGIMRAFGPLPTCGSEQNALWYRLFKSVESEPAVREAHRGYLFARDYAVLAFVLMVLLGAVGFGTVASLGTAFGYFGLLVVQFLLAGQAARNQGKRLVTTVLALKGAQA